MVSIMKDIFFGPVLSKHRALFENDDCFEPLCCTEYLKNNENRL
jgi:hypothetical protein